MLIVKRHSLETTTKLRHEITAADFKQWLTSWRS